MAKTVTLRIENPVYRTFINRANAEKRSLSNFIEMAVLQYARMSELIEEEEMEEILSDKTLLRRLKRGSRDTAARRGRLVG
ncbi:MAG: CopG family transcriptional regulator [Deltaproteobacteria bacterium]|nr:CopG family transcriptional regulator [Deltaproteobacteria bacterium]